MDRSVALKIEIDDSQALQAFRRLGGAADDVGKRRGGTGASDSGATRGESKSKEEKETEKLNKSFMDVVRGQVFGNVSNSLIQAMNPLKTAWQQNESLARGTAEALGAVLGEKFGIGATAGSALGRLGVEGALNQPNVVKTRLTNEDISAMLQAEGETRASMGIAMSKEDYVKLGNELRPAVELRQENRINAIRGADEVVKGSELSAVAVSSVFQMFRDFMAMMISSGGGAAFQKITGHDE